MSTGPEATADAITGLCQPSCERVRYTTREITTRDLPSSESRTASPNYDGHCLLDVTRRRSSKFSKVQDSIDSSQSSHNPVERDNVTYNNDCNKEQYTDPSGPSKFRRGALDSLSCLCEVLLAFDIEPCCVIPSLRHIPSQNSGTPQRSHVACQIRKDSYSVSSAETLSSSTAEKDNISRDCCSDITFNVVVEADVELNAKKADCCSKKSCCTSKASKVTAGIAPEGSALETGGHVRCCTSSDYTELDSAITTKRTDDCSQEACCGSAIPKPVRGCSEARCCSMNLATDVHQEHEKDCCEDDCCEDDCCEDDCCKDDCCSIDASAPVCVPSHSEENRCSEDSCCNGNEIVSPCAYTGYVNAKPNALRTITTATPAPTTFPTGVDIEKGLFEPEHLVISVQGMTCVGCEKKLYRSLESFPAVSNIKTSLVLAQAEFDLTASASIDSNNITNIIERMTGFTCKKVTQLGSYLDLIVDGNSQELVTATDLPIGVTDLSIIDRAMVRVTYHPEIVGARDLLSDKFFRKAKLGPVAPRAMTASGRSHVRTMFFMTLLSALLTTPVLILAWAPLPKHEILYGGISLALATIVQTVIAAPFYVNALKALVFSQMIEMDLLIVLSTSMAFIYSIIAYAYLVAGQPLLTGQFFETSTLLVTLIMVGRCVSAYARHRAVESISIESLQTPTALLTDMESHQEREIDARLLQYQDTFKVLPDTSVVTDGIVIAGETEVDESMITGEARLVTKKPGMSVVAGSINHSGTLIVRLTHLPHENTIKSIGSMVDEAKSTKPKIQEIADRVASIFVPVILIITGLVFLVWIAVGIAGRHESAMTASIVAMTYAISSLIISCPCAIGLAVPMVVAIAGGVAAKHGLIFKSAETIAIARNVSHVIFDKTGTLTQGELSVAAEIYPTKQSEMLGPIIMGLTANSKHPVSLSIAAHMEATGVQPTVVHNVSSTPGNGIEATWKGMKIRAGNPRWLGVENSPAVRQILLQGLTLFCVTMDEDLVAVFGLGDSLRPDAVEVVNELKRRSIDISIVSGDNEGAVQSIARLLGIPPSHVRSGCSPVDKQMYVKEMLACEKSIVMFCGDGTNDAVALAQASIGMHMNERSDIAQSAADVVLMRPSLSNILVLIDLSKAFYRRVTFNFLWSFVYNAFAILLAAGAFPDARIPPQFAGLGEIASVLPVIAIAMQLRWFKYQGPK